MNYDKTITTSADRERAWAALTAVTTWPQWTPSISTVQPLDGPDLAVGHRFRIKQPGFPSVVWRVSELLPDESFTWAADSPGVHSVGYHRLKPRGGGRTQIEIGVNQTGVLSGLLGLLTAARTRRFLEFEANGLKAASEAAGEPGAGAGA